MMESQDPLFETQEAFAAWCQDSSNAQDWPEAIRRWRRFRIAYPTDVWGHVREGLALVNAGKPAEGKALLEAAERQFDDEPAVHLALAEIAMADRDYPKAMTRWERLRDAHPELPWGAAGIAKIMLETGRIDEAEGVLAPLLGAFPDNASLLANYATCAALRRHWPEALRRWREVTLREPANHWGHLGEAEALLSLGHDTEAQALMALIEERFPHVADEVRRLRERPRAATPVPATPEPDRQRPAPTVALRPGSRAVIPVRRVNTPRVSAVLADRRTKTGIPREGANQVSVVLTSCARQDLLEQTLDSFFANNTYPIHDFFVIEDGNGDRNRHLARKYAQCGITWLETGRRMGQVRAIDMVYSQVKTDLVFHCEDDWQFLRPRFMERSITVLNTEPGIAMVALLAKEDPNSQPASERIYFADWVPYRLMHDCYDAGELGVWHGFSWNPGLRRLRDYRLMGSFRLLDPSGRKRPTDIEKASGYFYRRHGFRIALLAEDCGPGFVRHIGDEGRHVEFDGEHVAQ